MSPQPHPGVEKSEQLTKTFIEEAAEAATVIDAYLTGGAETIEGDISVVALQRIRRVTGESELSAQLTVLRDLYDSLSLVDQTRALLYVAGYPAQSLLQLGGDDIRETVAKLEAFGSRRVYEARQKTQEAMAKEAVRTSSHRLSEDDQSGEQRWDHRAACKGKPLELFFPEKGQSARDAKKICDTCTVKSECLEEETTLNQPIFGVRGGMSERERKAWRRRVYQMRRGRV